MIKFKDILSTTNVTVLIIMAGGNLIVGVQGMFQEFRRMDCINNAIYNNATQNEFMNCILKSGIFSVDGVNWILAQFVLTMISIMAVAIIETKKRKQKKASNDR